MTAALDALCLAVAKVAEQRGRQQVANEWARVIFERDALRDTLRDERAATNLLLAGLRDEVARLARYARHRSCSSAQGEPCDCGFDAASATPDSPQTMVDKLHAATAKLFAPDTEGR
jgi:cell division protein FtsL